MRDAPADALGARGRGGRDGLPLHPAVRARARSAAAVRPTFGLVKLPVFFEVHSYKPPLEDPWDFVRSMLVPWLAVGAPLAGTIVRLTAGLTIDGMGEHWVRTARAKGVATGAWSASTPRRRCTRRSRRCSARRRPCSSPTSCSWRSSSPCPGSSGTWRALAQNVGGGDKSIDIPMIQAISIWAAVLIVVM